MSVRGRSFECERACEWVSLELDGELSDFERTLLGAHLAECGDCRAFREDVASVTHQLRASALEQPERAVRVVRHRRRASLRLAPAAAAIAVLAVGLGSVFGALNSGDLLGPSVDRLRAGSAAAAVDIDVDALKRGHLRQMAALQEQRRTARLVRKITRREGGLVAPTSAGPVTKSP
jgi:predicted anti-sigma-YlaC factor YlaD